MAKIILIEKSSDITKRSHKKLIYKTRLLKVLTVITSIYLLLTTYICIVLYKNPVILNQLKDIQWNLFLN